MSQVIIAYHSTKDDDDKSCVDIFAQEKGCPPFWTEISQSIRAVFRADNRFQRISVDSDRPIDKIAL